uniref:Putative 2S sulfur-rich seed storage protein 2-like isoform X1 n=1 Tax=Davidia involucrata TaxID=16924 RepID=A0A5B7BLZ3_DAVIN
MAKLTTLAATFSLLFVAVMASITIDEENPSQSQRCGQQIQSQRLNACQQYVVQGSRSIMNQGGWREEFERCCEELEQMDEKCRCDGIRRAVQQQQQQGELQAREMREIVQTAKSLPGLCRMGPRRCDIRAVWF